MKCGDDMMENLKKKEKKILIKYKSNVFNI